MAVAESSSRSFALRNAGDTSVEFAWAAAPPYSLDPPSGTLPAGASVAVTATFAPCRAAVCDAEVQCSVAPGVPPLRVTLRGVGKLPFVRASEPVVDFGTVAVGRAAERTVQLLNATPAAAPYTVRRADESSHDFVFSAAPSAGRLAGGAAAPLRVAYTPAVPGAFSLEAFVIATPGGAPATLTLRGTAAGPAVTISAPAMAFGFVPLDTATEVPPRFLQLDNASELPVPFEVDSGGEGAGAFHVTPRVGAVPPRGCVQLAVAFRPAGAANFHRRLTVLLEHAAPLCCDLSGSAFTPKARPPLLPPDVLAAHRGPGATPTPPGQQPPRDVAAEFVRGDAASGVCLDAQALDFGACGAMRPPEVRVVTLQNRTGRTVEAFWHAGAGGSAFVVTPESAEVAPRGVAVFRVSFRPTRAATAYEAHLECHAHLKSQRGWRLAEGEGALLPPWCAPLRCVGHTHAPDAAAQPQPATLSARRVAFAPVPPGGAAYRTLLLRLSSNADGPAAWALAPLSGADDEPAGPFAVRPTAGVLHPGEAAVLLCAFFAAPDAASGETQSAPLRFSLNGIAAPGLDAELEAAAYAPAAVFELPEGAPLRLLPTCAGGASTRALRVRNPHPLPVRCAWAVPPPLAGVLAPSPASFELRGRDEATVTWTFAPASPGDFAAEVPLTLSTSDGNVASEAVVRLSALVAPCAARLEPRAIDAGVAALGATVAVAATLHNDSDAPVQYAWRPSEPPGALAPAVAGGSLGPRESVSLALAARCGAPGDSRARIALAVGAASNAPGAALLSLEVALSGAAPALRIVDAAVPGMPPAAAWAQLGVDALNAGLAVLSGAAPPAGDDSSSKSEVAIGVAGPGAAPSTAHVWLRNDGAVEAPWALRLSHEADVVPERWVREEAPEDADAQDALALRLFDAAPRQGVLAPGGTVRVTFAYSHEAPGAHSQLARLTVGGAGSGGAGLPLRLTGRTLRGAASPALCGPGVALGAGGAGARTLRCSLAPQPLGLAQPPAQCVTLRNAAAVDVQYVLDTAPLAAAAAASGFGFPFLTCLNPTGWLPARGAAALHFAFRPVEAGPIAVALPLLLLAQAGPIAPPDVSVSGATSAFDGYNGADDGAHDVEEASAPDGAAAEVALIELSALGFHPLRADAAAVVAQADAPVGRAAALPEQPAPPALPGQLGAASPAALVLGTLPPRGAASATVTLAPAAGGAPPLRFRWELDEGALPGGATLTVVPQSGRLPAGGVACTVTLRGGDGAARVRTALRCIFEPRRAPVRRPGGRAVAEEEEEEIFAQHGIHLGKPLVRPPRERTSVLKAATISSALKHPIAMRDMLPPAAPAAARLAAQPDASLPADLAGIVIVTVAADFESDEAVAERAAAAAFAAGPADPYDEPDEYVDASDDEAPHDDDDDAMEDEPDDAGPGLPRPSGTSSMAVDGVVDSLLDDEDGWEQDAEAAGDAAAPEEADEEAIAAGAAFLETLETLLDEADTLPSGDAA